MQIQSSLMNRSAFPALARADKSSPSAEQADTNTSTDSVSFDSDNIKQGLLFAGIGSLGFVPVVGAGVNGFTAVASAAVTGKRAFPFGAVIASGGTLSNLAGSAVGAYGLMTGNSSATNIGMSLLGLSGLATFSAMALTYAQA